METPYQNILAFRQLEVAEIYLKLSVHGLNIMLFYIT